jgi:hypothetical protein
MIDRDGCDRNDQREQYFNDFSKAVAIRNHQKVDLFEKWLLIYSDRRVFPVIVLVRSYSAQFSPAFEKFHTQLSEILKQRISYT